MHIYYGKYLEKVKNERDQLIIEEVEGENLNFAIEQAIETLSANYEMLEKCLHKELAGEPGHVPASMSASHSDAHSDAKPRAPGY